MDTVKEGYRKGGSRTGGMQERRDVRMEGCRKEECMKRRNA